MEKNYFIDLSNIECSIEKKNWFTYVSWSDAWTAVKKVYPDSTYRKVMNELYNSFLFKSGTGGMVLCEVTINGITHVADLAITNFSNKAIPYADITSTDIQNTTQRAFAKAIAMHWLWLYVYRGEDLPEDQETGKAKEVITERIVKDYIAKFKSGEMSWDVDFLIMEARKVYTIYPDQETKLRALFSKEIL